jgi:hypothetical protein
MMVDSPTIAIVWVALLLRIQDITSSVLDLATGNMTEVLHGFPRSLQANSGIVSRTAAQMVLSTCFPIHYSVIMLPFDTVGVVNFIRVHF